MTSQSPNHRRVVVLDTSAFVAGFDPFSSSDEQVTAPAVETEIRRNSMIKMRFEIALESGKVKIKTPNPQSMDKAQSSAIKVGDAHNLSEADIQLLALAVQLKSEGYKPQIITDDYSIQNVAKQLGIEFVALTTFGIKRLLEWIRYCPACHKHYSTDSKFMNCQICGTELKRKPQRQPK